NLLPSTPTIPNSPLPVLIYRGIIPYEDDRDALVSLLTGNHFRVDSFAGAFPMKHYHSNTHECYCFVKGSTTYLLGNGDSDDKNSYGQRVKLSKGDVMILPAREAGTVHCNLDATEDMQYCAAYPKEIPHWDVKLGKEGEEQRKTDFSAASAVQIPISDPNLCPARAAYSNMVDQEGVI
ncbi:unnamed protein product, partial [Clonostachys chloroleuca]